MLTSEVLNTAADLIEKRGWAVGEGWPEADDTVTALCLEGGIMAALDIGYANYCRDFLTCHAYHSVRAYLDGVTPFGWNDAPKRTASEVIEVLRACALIESAREQDSAWQTYATNVARVTV